MTRENGSTPFCPKCNIRQTYSDKCRLCREEELANNGEDEQKKRLKVRQTYRALSILWSNNSTDSEKIEGAILNLTDALEAYIGLKN